MPQFLTATPPSSHDFAFTSQRISCRCPPPSSDSSRPVGVWGLILGDSTAATAILDRLLHHCTVLTINGDCYRLFSAKKANL